MGILEIIIPIVVGFGGLYLHSKFEDKDREISDLKEELGRIKRILEREQSSAKHANELYDSLLEKYYKVLEEYNIPINWESLKAEEEQEDEDEQMAGIFVKGKFGTRVEKVPAKYVNFKRRN